MEGQISPETQAQISQTYGQLPLSFIANVGQIDNSDIEFHLKAERHDIFFLQDEIVFSTFGEVDGEIVNAVVTSELVGANPDTEVLGLNQLSGIANFLIGPEENWQTNVPTYEGVYYDNIYPGIDLVFTGTEQRDFKRDFIVEPQVDPGQIAMDFSGVEDIRIREDGALVLQTVLGELVEDAPVVYQDIEGDRVYIDAAYNLLGEGQVGFQLGDYDPNYTLVIDPILEYSTYLGGPDTVVTETEGGLDTQTGEFRNAITSAQVTSSSADSAGYAITVDSAGAAYVTGETFSASFPVTVESFTDPDGNFITPSVNSTDIFVTKFNTDGTGIAYSTYIGGTDRDVGYAIAVDVDGSTYITGETESESDFITGVGDLVAGEQLQSQFGGGATDAFIVKLSPTGTELDYATYIGGDGSERGLGIAVDNTSSAYIVGSSSSLDFPTTVEAFQQTNNAESIDGFVAKINVDGNALVYSSYIGGSDFDEGTGIAINEETGVAYITGTTESTNFPTTVGAFDTSFTGESDVFVTKINADGSALEYSTYIGGSENEISGGIDIDSRGAAYITGITPSTDFPTTPGAFDTSFGGGTFDAYITKLSPDGSELDYSTFIGGNGNEGINFLPQVGANIAVDRSGSAYIVGSTTFSNDFPIFTPGEEPRPFGNVTPAQPDFFQNALRTTDAFIVKIAPNGDRQIYGSYIGSEDREEGYGIALDRVGAAYITGLTFSTNSNLRVDLDGLPQLFEVDANGNFILDGSGEPILATNPFNGEPFFNPRLPFPTTPGAFQSFDPSSDGIVDLEVVVISAALIPTIGEAIPDLATFNRTDAFATKWSFEGASITEFDGSVDITEGDTTDTYSLELTIQPTSNVTIDIASDDQSTVVPSSITFTPENWNIPRFVTVTAVDDTVLEGPHTSTITHSVTSTDPNYNVVAVGDVIANVTDNEFGINVSPTSGLTTSEAGQTAEFSIVLGNVPSTNVVIPISSSNPDEGRVSVNLEEEPLPNLELTFNQINWDIPQIVTVTGVDDDIADGDIGYAIVTDPAISEDINYNGLNSSNVQVVNIDNDEPPPFGPGGAVITQSNGSTQATEGGVGDSYTFVLISPPIDDVFITIETDDQSATSPLELTFTPDNWDIPQTVAVGAVNDQVIEGNHTSTITHLASSSDANFNNIPIDSITVSITDNAGVVINQSNNSTDISEAGLIDSYTLALTRQPTDDVEIAVRTDSQSTAEPVSLVFTPENWQTPQTVTIAAVDDLFIEETQTSTITHTARSADPSYNELAIDSITATIADNDIPPAGITIIESEGLTNLSEGGAADTYMVVLDAPPISDVTVEISPDNQSIATPMVSAGANARTSALASNSQSTPATVTFTRDNWQVPQMVSVTAVDDSDVEGDHTSTIIHTARSADANYNNMTPATITATIADNDIDPINDAINWDIDSDGSTDALTDGLLAMRYLLGLTGEPLIREAIGIGANRSDADRIVTYLDGARNTMLDVDGNGMADAFTDGMLAVRYLFGLTGDSLIDGAIGTGAIRNTASEISAFLQSFDLPEAGM